jgi:hypothetical protein
MTWAGHVTCMGEKRNAQRSLIGNMEGKSPVRKHNVNGMILLQWILRR